MLTTMPAELILKIFSYVSFDSIPCLLATSQFLHSFIHQHGESIIRSLCFPRLTNASTCSATGLDPARYSIKSLSRTFDPGELGKVIRAQRSMSQVYDNVHTWRDYAHIRHEINRNWRNGCATVRWIVFEEARNWRFKLDPESRTIVTSRAEGGFSVFNRGGKLLCSTRWPGEYPHIELSEGYLCVTEGEFGFMIYRKATILHPPSPLLPAHMDALICQLSQQITPASTAEDYLPFNILAAGHAFSAMKIRFPILCAVSYTEGVVCLWDLTDGSASPRTTFSIKLAFNPDSNNIQPHTYIDFDCDCIYVTGTREVTVWSIRTGKFVGAMPVPCLDGESYYPNWKDVRHDPLQRSVVAINENGQLLWTPRFRPRIVLGMEEFGFDHAKKTFQRTVVLRLHPTIIMGELCVENGRAVFSTLSTSCARQTLWLLILDDFENHAMFKANPPRLICISPLLPTMAPVTRIEMTSDEIFVTAQSAFSPYSGVDYRWYLDAAREVDPLNLLASWSSTKGEILIDLSREGDGNGVEGPGDGGMRSGRGRCFVEDNEEAIDDSVPGWHSSALDDVEMDAVIAFSFAA